MKTTTKNRDKSIFSKETDPFCLSVEWLKSKDLLVFLIDDTFIFKGSDINHFFREHTGKTIHSISSSDSTKSHRIDTNHENWVHNYMNDPNNFWSVFFPKDESWLFLYGVDYYIFAGKKDLIQKLFKKQSSSDFIHHAKKISAHKSLEPLAKNMIEIYERYSSEEILYKD